MSNTLNSGTLKERGIKLVEASNADKVAATTSFLKVPLARKLTSKGFKLPLGIQKMMMPKLKSLQNQWPSPSPSSLFQSAAATEWVFKFFSADANFLGHGINSAWLSVMAKPGALLLQESTQMLVICVAGAQFGFLGWHTQVSLLPDGRRVFLMQPDPKLLAWHHVLDLTDWKVVPVQPVLVSDSKGPVGWQQAGEPLPLHFSICLEGVNLTVKQIKDVIKQIGGGDVDGKKKQLQLMLIEMTLPKDLQDVAAQKLAMAGQAAQQDEIDSQFSEIISDLDRDDGNCQDVKELKKRKKRAAAKRRQGPKDATLESRIPKRKAKSKAKSKAKAKVQCKKRKVGFVDCLLKRSKAKVAAVALDNALDKAEPSTAGDGEAGKQDPTACGQALPSQPSSSSGDGGQLPPPALHPLPAPAPGTPAPGTPGTRAHSAKVHKSPDWLMSQLAPPGAVMGIGFKDHRFSSASKLDATGLVPPYTQKHYSLVWGGIRTWQEALIGVHSFNWEKWSLLKSQAPLRPDEREQRPGDIPQAIMDDIGKFIEEKVPGKKVAEKAGKKKQKL